MTKSLKRTKAPPKTSRQRKAEFDSYMKNRGGADPTRPERWATVFFLTKQSADWIARIREEARFEGSQPSKNAALFEDLLRVYLAWRSNGGGPVRESAEALNGAEPPAKLSADLVAFEQSVEELRRTLLDIEGFQDRVLEAHRAERWTAFESLVHRLRGPCSAGEVPSDERRLWHSEFEDYLQLLMSRTSDWAASHVTVPVGRGHLFSRVLQRLKR